MALCAFSFGIRLVSSLEVSEASQSRYGYNASGTAASFVLLDTGGFFISVRLSSPPSLIGSDSHMLVCGVIGFVICTITKLHYHVLLVSTSMVGATAFMLGVDCFTRSGLKEVSAVVELLNALAYLCYSSMSTTWGSEIYFPNFLPNRSLFPRLCKLSLG